MSKKVENKKVNKKGNNKGNNTLKTIIIVLISLLLVGGLAVVLFLLGPIDDKAEENNNNNNNSEEVVEEENEDSNTSEIIDEISSIDNTNYNNIAIDDTLEDIKEGYEGDFDEEVNLLKDDKDNIVTVTFQHEGTEGYFLNYNIFFDEEGKVTQKEKVFTLNEELGSNLFKIEVDSLTEELGEHSLYMERRIENSDSHKEGAYAQSYEWLSEEGTIGNNLYMSPISEDEVMIVNSERKIVIVE